MAGDDPILELDEAWLLRAQRNSDDDISPSKYYDAYLLVVIMFPGFISFFFV